MTTKSTSKRSMGNQKPTLTDRFVIFVITKIPKVNHIISMGVIEAYDTGFEQGFVAGTKQTHGKKYSNKIKKALKKERYKVNLNGKLKN